MNNITNNAAQDYNLSEEYVKKVNENGAEYPSKKDTTDFDIPEGYMTGDEFSKRVKEGLRKKLQENGYL